MTAIAYWWISTKMAKDLLVRVVCDYCGEKFVGEAEAPNAELLNWIVVVMPEGDLVQMVQHHFCKRLCAVNYLRNGGPVIIPVTE